MQLGVEAARILSFPCANRPENFLCCHWYLIQLHCLFRDPSSLPAIFLSRIQSAASKQSRSVLFSELRDLADEDGLQRGRNQSSTFLAIRFPIVLSAAQLDGLWKHQAIHQPIQYLVRRLHGTYINIQEHTLLGKPPSLRVAASLRLHEEGGQRRVPPSPPKGALVASRPPPVCRTAL